MTDKDEKNQYIGFDIESFIAIYGGYASLIYGLCSVLGPEKAAIIAGSLSFFYGFIPQLMDIVINYKLEIAEIQARSKN